MSAKYFAILTNLGAAKMANATALGTKLNVTHMAVGDGGGSLPTPDPGQTALRGERRRAALNMLSVDPNNASQIIAEQVIPENEGGWWIREVGLYDSDGILIAVANCPETYKPQLQEGSGRTQTIRMVLIVSSTEAVTLKIDPAVVLATRQYVDNQVIEVRGYIDSQMDAHVRSRNHPDATLSAKGFVQLSSDDNSAAEDRAATPAAVKKVRALVETKAPLNSPSLTGTPTAPTPVMAASGLEIANAEFVVKKVAALIGSAPGVLDTLQEIAAALNNNPDFANEMIRQLAGKQPLDGTLTNISGKNVAELIEYIGAVAQKGGDYKGFFGFGQVGTLPIDQNPNYLVTPADTVTDGFACWLQNQWHGHTVKWGLIRGTGADVRCAALEVGSIQFRFFPNGDITANGKPIASQEWANSQFPLKNDLGDASERNIGASSGNIPDIGFFSSSLNSSHGYKYIADSTSPTGMFLIQWGEIGASSGDVTTNFPIPFPNKCIRTFATQDYTPGSGVVGYICCAGYGGNTINFISRSNSLGLAGSFFAIGY